MGEVWTSILSNIICSTRKVALNNSTKESNNEEGEMFFAIHCRVQKKRVWINSSDCDDTLRVQVFGWEPWCETQIASEAPTTDLPQRGKPLSFSDPALLPSSDRLKAVGHEMTEIRFRRTRGGQSKKYSVSFKTKKNNFTSVSNFATIISSDLQFCIILVHSIFNNDPFNGPLKGSQCPSKRFPNCSNGSSIIFATSRGQQNRLKQFLLDFSDNETEKKYS